ncbi:uncharacterized protein HHUB_2339 [Halobacterium hubeiense]|uniref:Uncharacterized protein n=2 Tax=Halobacterium TaxID=2239 RepID=A0A0U5CXX7_9EURY|nr:hypothetical protein [Halobacterium hubeiense]CQH56139.1 uncharacterized protein HHUB_2339 [Halobacterium hubeiense]
MTLQSTVHLTVGAGLVAVGTATAVAPARARAVSRSLFPTARDDLREWRAVGVLTASVGLALLASA